MIFSSQDEAEEAFLHLIRRYGLLAEHYIDHLTAKNADLTKELKELHDGLADKPPAAGAVNQTEGRCNV